MRIVLVSRSGWGQIPFAEELGPEFDVLSVSAEHVTYEELVQRYPPGWRPDAIVCWSIDYMPIPAGIEEADCFTAAVVGDWNLAGQAVNLVGDAFDVLIADRAGCEALARLGFNHVRHALLWGFHPGVHARLPDVERDIDVLFIGSANPYVQAHRATWLARIAQLSSEYRVAILTEIYGPKFTELMNRARIVFNRSIRSEMNQRAYEAAACGALLFCERENVELPDVFSPGEDCIVYGPDDLEDLLRYYLEHEEDRARIAEAGYRNVQPYAAKECVRRVFQVVRQASAEIGPTERPFRSLDAVDKHIQRAWHWLGAIPVPYESLQAMSSLVSQAEKQVKRPDILDLAGAVLGLAGQGFQALAPDHSNRAFDLAVRYQQQALEMLPDYAVPEINLGLILEKRGQLRSASEAYERAERALASPLMRLEQVFGALAFGEWDDLRREIEAVWSQLPFGTPEWIEGVRRVLLWGARRRIAMIANLTAEPARAIHYGRLASDMMPHDWFSWLQPARAYAHLGRLQESAEHYCRALDTAPLIETLWLQALPILERTGHPTFAQRREFAVNLARACTGLDGLRAYLGVEFVLPE